MAVYTVGDNPGVESAQVSIQTLPGQHRDALTGAIANLLSSHIAEMTYAQIIDGLPLADVLDDTYSGNLGSGHPLLTERTELSEGVLEQARQPQSSFDATVLQMDASLVHAYQLAPPGSRAFRTRLIELVARAVHQIAVWLFQQEPKLPADDPLVSWRPSQGELERFYPDGFPPTLFQHEWYRAYDQYPQGVADGVGYWAEARIFGGVVLFDRREPGSAPNVEADAIYLHPDRYDVIYRIFRILDGQKQQLVEFLVSDDAPPHEGCPLPFIGSKDNRQRVDPEEPVEATGIYRDRWERRPMGIGDRDRRRKDVVDTFNYLSQDDWLAAGRRAMLRRAQLVELECMKADFAAQQLDNLDGQ